LNKIKEKKKKMMINTHAKKNQPPYLSLLTIYY